MLWKQDLLEKQLAALQQLVRELSAVTEPQVTTFKKPSLEATRMPTIEEEDTDEDEDPTNTDDKEEDHSSKKKSKALKRLMKNLRSFFKLFK